MAGSAYWALLRRITVVAGCIDLAWIPFYGAFGASALALGNVASVAMYATAYWAIGQRRNVLAISLIWLEVLAHSAAASLLIGWDSGFHYFLLMFIPAIVIGTRMNRAVPMVVVLLVFYLGLEQLSKRVGPLSPLAPEQLMAARAVNVALVFGMFYAMAAYYRRTVIAAERRLLQMATTDPLTGLDNRSQFHARANSELARSRRHKAPVSLILADIDAFKRINDEFGHDAGDQVLKRLADLLRRTLRETDVLARWGGEEFIALLPSSDETAAAQLAERIRQAVASLPIELEGRTLQVTLSMGIAECHGIDDLQAATQRADRALYASKHGGRNRITRVTSLPAVPQPA